MLFEVLRHGADRMGIEIDDDALNGIVRYHEMLTLKNESLNLTRISSQPRESAFRNYLDSLAPLAIKGLLTGEETILDAGSGAGLPGIPLAIALRDARVTMIESAEKKVAFIREVIKELGLTSRGVHSRLEDAGRKENYREKYDVCVSRALAPLNVLAEITLPFVKVGGLMIAYKGPSAGEELERGAQAIALLGGKPEGIIPSPAPGDDWEHKLVIVRKISATPKGYPRRAGTPSKKPL